MVKFVETPVQIGRGEGLSAMLTHPPAIDTSRPVFVILNAGLLHRVGPFRLHVQLARRLAEQGFPALRLDLSGIGYSPRHPEYRGLEAALEDARVVFRWLRETYSLNKPVLMGSCSGADLAHRITVADERVQGYAMLDGYAYHNTRSALSYYATRAHRPRMWGKWLQAHLQRVPEDQGDEEFWDSEIPPVEQFRSELAVLIARAIPLLYVYSGSVREYAYEHQFFDVCPQAREGRVTVRYYPHADHTYLLERHRQVLLDSVCEWATRSFPAAADEKTGSALHHTSVTLGHGGD